VQVYIRSNGSNFQVDHIRQFINCSYPEKRIEIPSGIGDGQRLRAPTMSQHRLSVPAHNQNGGVGVGVESHQIRRPIVPIVPIEALKAGCVARHLDDVRVALHSKQTDSFGNGGDNFRIEDVLANWVREVDVSAGRVYAENGVFSYKDGHFLVAGLLLLVVEEVPLF